jgi:hypothetical protein
MGSARKVASNSDDRKRRASGLFGKHLHPFALKSCREITLGSLPEAIDEKLGSLDRAVLAGVRPRTPDPTASILRRFN